MTKFFEKLYYKSILMYVLLRKLTLVYESAKMPDLKNKQNQKPIRDEVKFATFVAN